MKGKLLSAVSRFFSWIKNWLWNKPTEPIKEEPLRIPAKELNLKDTFKIIIYQGQRINMNNSQLLAFNRMSRNEKRKVKSHWARMERKKEIIFQEVNGQIIAIRNLDYEKRNNIRK
jgi:hypothetical protein